MERVELFIFGWPSQVGGAGTKLTHLLRLLAGECRMTVVPPEASMAGRGGWRVALGNLGVEVRLWEELPERLEGWGLALCNGRLFDEGLALRVKQKGLKFAWSNEMMWHFKGELGALFFGWIDAVLYVSPGQRAVLEPHYTVAVTGGGPPEGDWLDPAATSGLIGGKVPWVMTGNYIDPAEYPFLDRSRGRRKVVTVGRLSRADPMKYPADFPDFYEGLGLERARFRVMGWSEQVAAQWPGRRFAKSRWTLLPVAAEDSVAFLHSLDLFVYDTGPHLRESWGRAVVEAMLCGAVPLVPKGGGHHLDQLVPHGVAGFHCATREEFGERARELEADPALRHRMSRAGREWAVANLCDAEAHKALWRQVFCGERGLED